MAKHILKGTNGSNAEELGPFLELMKQFLSVDDEFSSLRMEWIFGVADFVVRSAGYQVFHALPKAGVAAAEAITAQVCRYFSPVLKTASSPYSQKESALQALLSNRRSQSQAVLASLKAILEAVLEDPSGRILGYLQKMDPPTYQFARYWDWIKPWVENEVRQNSQNQHIPAYRAELELSINVLSLVEQIERGAVATHASDHGGFIEYPLGDGGPKPYLIWELLGQETLDRKQVPGHRYVEVQFLLGRCSVSESLPTGEHNLALTEVYEQHQDYQGSQGGAT